MKNKLIIALVIAVVLLIAAVGVVVYMESGANRTPVESTPEATDATPADTQQTPSSAATEPEQTTEAPIEETVGISLPTEDPDEVGPEYTWPEDETGSAETVATVDPDATFDPDENETPEMEA